MSPANIGPESQDTVRLGTGDDPWVPPKSKSRSCSSILRAEGDSGPRSRQLLSYKVYAVYKETQCVSTLMSIVGMMFLDMTPKTNATKPKINKWLYSKIKGFCTAKETTHKMKRQLIGSEKIFANDMTDKGLISNYINSLLAKTQTILLKVGRISE